MKIKPHPALEDIIDSYWMMDEAEGSDGLLPVFPKGYPIMEFYLGDKWEECMANSQTKARHGSTVIGLTSKPLLVRLNGEFRGVWVRFHPWSLPHIFSDIIEADKVYNMSLFFGSKVLDVENRLLSDFHETNIKETLDDFFISNKLLLRNEKDKRVEFVIRQIIAHKGMVSIGRLAQYIHLSQRRMEQLFHQNIGLSPKKYSNIVKFQYVLYKYKSSTSITNQAFDLGYYDQSHFIRHFKHTTGKSPMHFFKYYLRKDHRISNLYNFS